MVDLNRQGGSGAADDNEAQIMSDVTALQPAPVLGYEPHRPPRAPPELMPPASYRGVFKLALPSLVESIFSLAIAFTDTFVAGNGRIPSHNAAAAAAVGTMTYMQWFAGLMTQALGVGATAIVARAIGARRPRVANRVAGTALSSALLVGLVVAIFLFAFARPSIRACGLEGQAADFALRYLKIMVITICLQTAGIIGMACLRGAGDTFRPMLITGAIAVINAITVPALAYGWFGLPALDIRGNALGTMTAFAISGVATVILLLSGRAGLRLHAANFRIVPHVLWRILRIGFPSWAEGMLLWLGQFAIVILVINHNDAALATFFSLPLAEISGITLSAHTDVLRVESFAFLPGFGFGIAASALVGQFLGNGQPLQARRAAKMANRMAFATMTLAALPMVLFPGTLLRWVVNDAHVAEIGRWPMILAGLAQPGFAIAIIMGSALKGAGETVWPMISTIVGMCIIRFPLVVIASYFIFPHMRHPEWGLIAVWIGIFADLNFRAILNGIIFRRGKWAAKRL
ncbi:MAG: MATE family efflux transporter [Tepidisphaeraceae bacterium]